MNPVKFNRIPHLPWSNSKTKDDEETGVSKFVGKYVVVTEKMDGENTTLYSDFIHARSLSSSHHPSRSYVKALHASIKHLIPDDVRVCGENLYAKHSIHYTALPSYFLVFAVYEAGEIMGWKSTEAWCQERGLHCVPVLYRGEWDEGKIKACYDKYNKQQEGYVVRDLKGNMAKFVRPNHVQTTECWMGEAIVPNLLRTTCN